MVRFLIVDDSPMERFVLRKCLEKLGHEIVGEAKNGLEALNIYKKFLPDIVILDILFPKESGIDILKEIINYDNNAKVIMSTSETAEMVVVNTIQLGAKYFLLKPININLLTDVVNATLLDSPSK